MRSKTILVIVVLLFMNLFFSPQQCNGIAIPPDLTSLTHMAEVSDFVFIGKVTDIELTANFTYYQFNVNEYIKNRQNMTEITLQIYGGSTELLRRNGVSFDLDEEYLVFIVQDIRPNVAYGENGKILLEDVDSSKLDDLRYIHNPSRDTVFQGLSIWPRTISQGENITMQFMITNKLDQENTVRFIIEHHPTAYQVIDNENMTKKYFQIAKSVSIQPDRTNIYTYVLGSNYTGVNTIIISHQGRQILYQTFTVRELRVSNYSGNPKTVTYQIDAVSGYRYRTFFIVTGIIIMMILIRAKYRAPISIN